MTPPVLPPVSPAEMEALLAHTGLTLNPGQLADLVMSWRQVAALIATLPHARPMADDQAFAFRLSAPEAPASAARARPTPPAKSAKAAAPVAKAKPAPAAKPAKAVVPTAKAKPKAKPQAKPPPKSRPAAPKPVAKTKPATRAKPAARAKPATKPAAPRTPLRRPRA